MPLHSLVFVIASGLFLGSGLFKRLWPPHHLDTDCVDHRDPPHHPPPREVEPRNLTDSIYATPCRTTGIIQHGMYPQIRCGLPLEPFRTLPGIVRAPLPPPLPPPLFLTPTPDSSAEESGVAVDHADVWRRGPCTLVPPCCLATSTSSGAG